MLHPVLHVYFFDSIPPCYMYIVFLRFLAGSRPKQSKGTVIRVEVTDTIDKVKDEWQAKVDSVEEEQLSLLVNIAPSPPKEKSEQIIMVK